MPSEGQNVLVTLADGSETLAYWYNGQWWVGVPDHPQDIPLTAEVVFWREAD